jgi:hypothetical protein
MHRFRSKLVCRKVTDNRKYISLLQNMSIFCKLLIRNVSKYLWGGIKKTVLMEIVLSLLNAVVTYISKVAVLKLMRKGYFGSMS